MFAEDEFRVIPINPYYFINRLGEIKKRDSRGRKMIIKRDINGDLVCNLINRQKRPIRYRIVDLIAITFPEDQED